MDDQRRMDFPPALNDILTDTRVLGFNIAVLLIS